MPKKLKVQYKHKKTKDQEWRIKKAYEIITEAFGIDVLKRKTIGERYAKKNKK